mgnify:FL=1
MKKQPEGKPVVPLFRMDTPLVISDPQGSYTGRPEDVFEEPVQDADDL